MSNCQLHSCILKSTRFFSKLTNQKLGLLIKLKLLIPLCFLTSQAFAINWQSNQQIAMLFEQANVQGTCVVYDVNANKFIGYNYKRAKTRYIPASSFKIPHTLIGLATHAVQNVDEILAYGGKPQIFKIWEKDMSLRAAIKISNVAIYQTLAKRIGLKRMRLNLARMNYGNQKVGTNLQNFWLHGPLKISAIEQTVFLARFANLALAYDKNQQKAVHEIIQLEKGQNWTLYGKSGWANASNPDIGWWVGWVEKNAAIYSFAINIDMPHPSYVEKRTSLGKSCLKQLKIL